MPCRGSAVHGVKAPSPPYLTGSLAGAQIDKAWGRSQLVNIVFLMHPSSHWLLHFCRSWPAGPEFILQLQGLLGCLADVLRKSSCAGGFRDAVEEARANLQSQLLLNHSSAAFWARRQFELSVRSAHLLFGSCLWSHDGSGARPGTAFSFCPMPN